MQLSQKDQNAERTIHVLKSSNLPFYIAVWEASKATNALVVLHKRFYWEHSATRDSKRSIEKKNALVDIVCQDGEEWIKVSTVTEHRLIFELSKAHWEVADSSDEEDDGTESSDRIGADQAILDRLELVQSIDSLMQASRAHRVRYRNPKVRLVLPKISNPPPPQLGPLLERLRSTGAILEIDGYNENKHDIENLKSSVFPKLLPSPHPPLTDTLNIDCTILLALVSDLSHTSQLPVLPSYNEAIRRQINLETRDHLLPSSLWPAMSDKPLLCTEEAAKRMKEIVDTIGTPSERARTRLLLGEETDEEGTPLKDEKCRLELAKHSDYNVPPSFRIPISIKPPASPSQIESAIQTGLLPDVAIQISEGLTDINRSVFMYGWINGLTTISSNRTVARWIENTIERSNPKVVGPDVWVREPARSLLGKEKLRRK